MVLKSKIPLIILLVVVSFSLFADFDDDFIDEKTMKKYFHKIFPKLQPKNKFKKGDSKSQLFPIGFSKKSHFAYIIYKYHLGLDGGLYKFTILDLVKDIEVESYTFLDKNKKKILSDIKKYAIIKKKNIKVHRFPLKWKRDVYKAFAEGKENNCIVTLYSKKRGEKTISAFDCNYSYAGKEPSIFGYIKSPYENRIIVVVNYWDRWEMSTSESFKLVGSHLTVGFKKK